MLIAANWKMHKGPAETRAFFDAFDAPTGVEVIVCPPFVSLAAAVESGHTVYAQNAHWEASGAYTGETAPDHLLELGVRGTLVGHSERRQLFGETDEMVARRARGRARCRSRCDRLRRRDPRASASAGDTEARPQDPGRGDRLRRRRHGDLVIAYEPVWAIGTGLTATPEQAQATHAFVKSLLDARVLYGGSVKPENAAELLSQPDVDGALVGGASLDPVSLARDLPGRVELPLVTLVVLDGWGLAPPGPGNAVELAATPVFDTLWARYPHAELRASGEAVGLPDGQMGNSEVGHLTIGSGRILLQDLMRVNRAVDRRRPALATRRSCARSGGHASAVATSTCSVSSRTGGVHSHISHLRALLDLSRRQDMEGRTWIHAFTDGRDVSPTAAAEDLGELPAERIATVVGRYYAMDRDQRWERTDRAVDAICRGIGEPSPTIRSPPCWRATPPESPTSSSSRSCSPGARGSTRHATRRSSSTSGPTGPASSRTGCGSAAST